MTNPPDSTPGALALYTCELDRLGPKIHPCRRAHDALASAGHTYETIVFDKNRPLGLFTSGKRPELKEMSGQEKLPVLRLPDGTMIPGSGKIISWAKENAPGD